MESYILDTLIYSNLLTIIVIGFTLTYMIAKIPNFAHGTYAVVGGYVAFTINKILGYNPYLATPLAFLLVGLIASSQYYFVIRPMLRLKASPLSLTITTIAMEIILTAGIGMYVEYISKTLGIYGVYPAAFILKQADFDIIGLPGIFVISSLLVITLIISLYIFLTKTKIGVTLRAIIEDDELATVYGANVERTNILSWFLIGGLAGMAGGLFPLYYQMTPLTGTYMIVSIFAGSILGGITSIYTSVLGGYIVGLSETLGVIYLSKIFGPQIVAYRLAIPLLILIFTLMFLPRGFSGLIDEYLEKRIVKKIS